MLGLRDRTTAPSPTAPTGWTARDWRRLLQVAEQVDYEPGEILAAEGQPAQEFLLLTGGRADVYRGTAWTGRVSAGDCVGAAAMLRRAPYDCTVMTDRYCAALLLGPRQFHALIDLAPSFGRVLATSLALALTPRQPGAVERAVVPR